MINIVTPSTFQNHVEKLFVAKTDPLERKLHAAVGIAGEAGEILDALKKAWVYGKPLDTENILEEAGDILFYLQAMLTECGFSIPDAMAHNIDKLKKRYPEGWSPTAAIARADKEPGQ